MTSYLRLLIAAQVAAAGIALVAAIAIFPIRPEIGGPVGIAFWIAVTLVASALPISLPAGITVSVGSAPLLASLILGGPAAAGIVGALGTFDSREVRGQIPWYGTLSNHAQIAGPAAIAGILYEIGLRLGAQLAVPAGLSSVLAAAAAGIAYNALNNFLAALIVSGRSGQTLATVWAKLKGLRELLCMNYLISDAALPLFEHDAFTAQQVARTLPFSAAPATSPAERKKGGPEKHLEQARLAAPSGPEPSLQPGRARLIHRRRRQDIAALPRYRSRVRKQARRPRALRAPPDRPER